MLLCVCAVIVIGGLAAALVAANARCERQANAEALRQRLRNFTVKES